MAKKAHGIGVLTETEQQPGYCPERLKSQIVGCKKPEVRVDRKGFKYIVYPRDLSHERWKNHKPKKKPIVVSRATPTPEEIKELKLDIDLELYD